MNESTVESATMIALTVSFNVVSFDLSIVLLFIIKLLSQHYLIKENRPADNLPGVDFTSIASYVGIIRIRLRV